MLWRLTMILGKFLSTLSLRRATRANRLAHAPPEISIHALLAESDPAIDVFLAVWAIISIHALLAESDEGHPAVYPKHPIFLSTLSLRRATLPQRPHPDLEQISIHALLAESDDRCIL